MLSFTNSPKLALTTSCIYYDTMYVHLYSHLSPPEKLQSYSTPFPLHLKSTWPPPPFTLKIQSDRPLYHYLHTIFAHQSIPSLIPSCGERDHPYSIYQGLHQGPHDEQTHKQKNFIEIQSEDLTVKIRHLL